MKTMLPILCLFPLMVLAQEKAATSATAADAQFEADKKLRIEMMDKHMAAMQEHKACVSAAKNWSDMGACRGKMRDMRMEFREERMKMGMGGGQRMMKNKGGMGMGQGMGQGQNQNSGR